MIDKQLCFLNDEIAIILNLIKFYPYPFLFTNYTKF